MKDNLNYESPQIKEIIIEADSILCDSVFGTEGMGDRSGVFDDWQVN